MERLKRVRKGRGGEGREREKGEEEWKKRDPREISN